MKFSANLSMLFKEYSFNERFTKAASLGFEAVEFWFPFQEGGRDLLSIAREAGTQVILFNNDPGDVDKGEWGTLSIPGRQNHFRYSFEMALSLAFEFSCPRLHLVAGRLPKDTSYEKAWDVALVNLDWAIKQADSEITLVVECLNPYDMPSFFLSSPQKAFDLVKHCNHPRVRVLYDIYHAYRVGDDILARIENDLHLIEHIQIADYPGRHQPGTGKINFPAIFSLLNDKNYSGHVGLEYLPNGNTEDSFGWMENFTEKPAD
jgi:hydroxypyruvate isomerase